MELLKSLMDDSGIPFYLRTRSAVGESALFVARQSIYFDLFAALLNFGITPPPKWHPPYVNAHETPTRFLHPGDKKRLVRQAGEACLRNLPPRLGHAWWHAQLASGTEREACMEGY